MSFRFKQTVVTLDNYKTIFKACTPDVLDEIRSAVLDDTAIASFINPCGNDSYKLGQLRMAVREMIPTEYLNARLTGKTIYNIRQGFSKGIGMSQILRYYNQKELKLPCETIERLSDFLVLGTDISKMDFVGVPSNLVDSVCKGLYLGYPMWLLVDENCTLDDSMVQVLMRGMTLGVDVHQFIGGNWKKETILLIFAYAKSVDLNDLLRYINDMFDTESVRTLLDLSSRGVPVSRLCVKDASGAPVYNSYQMYELGLAIEEGVDTAEMYNASLSDFDIAALRVAEMAKKDRKLHASLERKYQ